MIRVELKDKKDGLSFKDVPIFGFFVYHRNDLCMKISESGYVFFETGGLSDYTAIRSQPIKRIVTDIEIKELY